MQMLHFLTKEKKTRNF